MPNELVMGTRKVKYQLHHAWHGVRMKYSLDAIPVEVLLLAVIEFVFISAFAALLWYVFGHH